MIGHLGWTCGEIVEGLAIERWCWRSNRIRLPGTGRYRCHRLYQRWRRNDRHRHHRHHTDHRCNRSYWSRERGLILVDHPRHDWRRRTYRLGRRIGRRQIRAPSGCGGPEARALADQDRRVADRLPRRGTTDGRGLRHRDRDLSRRWIYLGDHFRSVHGPQDAGREYAGRCRSGGEHAARSAPSGGPGHRLAGEPEALAHRRVGRLRQSIAGGRNARTGCNSRCWSRFGCRTIFDRRGRTNWK